MAGVAPERFLRTSDEIELRALILVADKAIEFQANQQKILAATIINYLGKSLGADK